MKVQRGVAVLLGSMLLLGEARADDAKMECAKAHEDTQTLRRSGQLVAARKRAIACSREACPKVVVAPCASWVAELDKLIPTVVFAVKDTVGNDTSDAKVALDGEPWLARLPVRATPVDPGDHVFEVTLADETRRVHALVREGESPRVLSLSFARPATPAPSAVPPLAPAPPGPSAPAPRWPLGLTVAGSLIALAGAGLLVWATTTTCADAERGADGLCLDPDPVNRRKMVGWGVGGAAVATGAGLLIGGVVGLALSKPSAPVRVLLTIGPGRLAALGWF